MCFGKAPKIVVPAPPPPSAEEVRAKKLAAASQELAIGEAGFDIIEDAQGNIKLSRRAPTEAELATQKEDADLQKQVRDALAKFGQVSPLEQQRADIESKLNEATLRRLGGVTPEVSPEARALVEREFSAQRGKGRTELETFIRRQLEEIGLAESRPLEDLRRQEERGFEEISRAGIREAGERGLNLTDTPISSELARERRFLGEDLGKIRLRLGEDISRNRRILSEEAISKAEELETMLRGAESGTILNLSERMTGMEEGSRQFQQTQSQAGEFAKRDFAQALRSFQEQLRQQSFVNRLNLANLPGQFGLGLGTERANLFKPHVLPGMNVPSTFGSTLSGAGSALSGATLLASAGIFSTRLVKEDISEVDYHAILEEVLATPVYHWKYKPELNDDRRHIGPMTEESPKEMVSEDGKMLISIDYLGVLFAAVKALTLRVKELEQANASSI